MNVPAKLAVFAAAVAVVFAAAFTVGAVIDPIASPKDTVNLATADNPSENGNQGGMGGMAPEPGSAPPTTSAPALGPVTNGLPGLGVSDRGYALHLADSILDQGSAVGITFSITSPDGGPVLNYRPTHQKELHLIVVRRDMTGFQHLHPDRAADGTWSVPVDLTEAGTYRVFADFAPAGLNETLTLGADLFVPGEFAPLDLPSPSWTWSADGYQVSLTGTPVPGVTSNLGFTVTLDGAPVTDLEPYLGAFGHLVSLRAGDLAYVHTHPAVEALAGQQGGPDITFGTVFPTSGPYRLYLNFSHAGTVRTAEFTVDVPEGASAAPAPPADQAPPAPASPAASADVDEPSSTEGNDDDHHRVSDSGPSRPGTPR